MGNNTRIATLLNGAISLLAVVAITLVCIVPTAFAEDGANTSDAPGAGADNSVEQIAGPVPNIIITNFTYGDGSVAVGSTFNLGFTFQNMGKVAVSNMVVTVDGGENTIANYLSDGFSEVAPYLTLSGHTYNICIILISNEAIEKIPADMRDAFFAACKDGIAQASAMVLQANEDAIESRPTVPPLPILTVPLCTSSASPCTKSSPTTASPPNWSKWSTQRNKHLPPFLSAREADDLRFPGRS